MSAWPIDTTSPRRRCKRPPPRAAAGRATASRGGCCRNRGRAFASSFPREGELAVAERLGAPGVVHLRVEFALRAHDQARARFVEPEEGALALEDLGQQAHPARVAAPAADGDPSAALDQREREAPRLLDHDPARSVAHRLADAVERGDEEGLDRDEVYSPRDETRSQTFDQFLVERAGEARAERRRLGHLDVPLGGDRAVQRAEAMARQREPLLATLDRL